LKTKSIHASAAVFIELSEEGYQRARPLSFGHEANSAGVPSRFVRPVT
jgi:hypothetical protein